MHSAGPGDMRREPRHVHRARHHGDPGRNGRALARAVN